MSDLVEAQTVLANTASDIANHGRAMERVNELVAETLRLLSEGIWKPETRVEEILEATGQRSRARSRFTELLEEPPGAYLRRHRLEAAAKLLEETELPISEIARLVGYAGVDSFRREFRKVHGEVPNVHRERVKLESEAGVSPLAGTQYRPSGLSLWFPFG